jgi:hypothetical protein
MGAVLVDDSMQTAMNAPAKDDGPFLTRAMEIFCQVKVRKLDLPTYNDTPNQPPVKGKRDKNRLKNSQIVCVSSSFAKSKKAKECLPAPEESQGRKLTIAEYLKCAVSAADERAEKAKQNVHDLRQARVVEAHEKAAAEAARPAEEKEADAQMQREEAGMRQVAASLVGPTGRLMMLAPVLSHDERMSNLATNVRRSTRRLVSASVNPDDLETLNRRAVEESLNAARTSGKGSSSSKRKRSSKRKHRSSEGNDEQRSQKKKSKKAGSKGKRQKQTRPANTSSKKVGLT